MWDPRVKRVKERKRGLGYWAKRPWVVSAWPKRDSARLKGPARFTAHGPAWLLGLARWRRGKARQDWARARGGWRVSTAGATARFGFVQGGHAYRGMATARRNGASGDDEAEHGWHE